MSFVPSLLLYNPLEALVVIMFCSVCIGRKMKLFDVVHCYCLGTINLLVQYSTTIINIGFLKLFLDIIVVCLCAIILNCYLKLVMKVSNLYATVCVIGIDFKIYYAFIAFAFVFISIPIGVILSDTIFSTSVNYVNQLGINELITDLIIRIIQLSTIFIIRKVVLSNNDEKNARKVSP